MKKRVFPLMGIIIMDFQLMAEPNTNVTTDAELSAENKIFYSKELIDIVQAKLIHNQFGQKKPIPKNGGKSIEFRKYNQLPKALVPITEGVTPDGQKMSVEKVVAQIEQYGGYVTVSDLLELTAIDDNIIQATKLIGGQAGATLDTITRDIINAGTSVQYGDDMTITARHLLVGGQEEGNNHLSVKAIKMAARTLKNQNAEPINGSFIAIVHPDIAYDLTEDPQWKNVKEYDPKDWYNGEIGRIAGVRFVETTEAKIFHAEDLSENSRELTVKSIAAEVVTINEALTASDQEKIVGRKVLIEDALYEVVSATANTLTLNEAADAAASAVIYPGEAGAEGRDVYSTLVLADNAYGVTDVEGGGLQHIVKQRGSAGTADPLDQRATVGWKATATAERLVEQYMVRIETTSLFESGAN